MPNVLPEAMACALPVVTTRFSGFSAELGRPGQDLLVTGRSPDEIAGHLFDLLSNSESRRNLGRSARAWMERNYDVEASLDQYADLCSRVRAEARSWHRGLLRRGRS